MKELASRAASRALLMMMAVSAPAVSAGEGVESRQDPAEARGADKTEERLLAEFLRVYHLDPDESLKHVPPPRPEGVRVYWKRKRPGFANRPDQFGTMTFRWTDPDRLMTWSVTTAKEGFRVRDLPEYLEIGIYPSDIDGEPDLLETRIPGDWIYRTGQPAEKMVRALEIRLQRMLKKRIALRLREVERDVVVVRGDYKSVPVAGRNKDQIEIYGKQIVPGGGGAGGGSGSYPEFLKWVGEWIARPLVSEVKAPPKGMLVWYYNARQPFTKEMQKEDHDEALVLKHLQEQTGLTFVRERRRVPILFVERAK